MRGLENVLWLQVNRSSSAVQFRAQCILDEWITLKGLVVKYYTGEEALS